MLIFIINFLNYEGGILIMLKEPKGQLAGIVTITIEDQFVIHDIKIIKSKKTGKWFIAMPNRRLNNGRYKDYCHPITDELRKGMTKLILDEFENT